MFAGDDYGTLALNVPDFGQGKLTFGVKKAVDEFPPPAAAEPVDRLAGRLVVWHGYGADTRAKRVLDQVASATRCSASLCSRCVRAIPRSIAVPPDTSFTG